MSEDNYAQFRAALVALGADLDKSAQHVVSQMASEGLKITKKNTPTNKDPHVIGGTLKRGWLKGQTLKVGNGYESSYSNNVYYGLYVNNGHRTVNGGVTTGYVPGVRMLEQGMDAAKQQTETLFNNEIAKVKAKTGF